MRLAKPPLLQLAQDVVPDPMLVPPLARIYLHAVDLHAEMHVNAARQARRAGNAHGLPFDYAYQKRMHTSRAALDRLLDSEYDALTLNTLRKASVVVGRELRLELV